MLESTSEFPFKSVFLFFSFEIMSENRKKLILESLNLSTSKENAEKTNEKMECMLCDRLVEFPAEKDEYLKHLFVDHRLGKSELLMALKFEILKLFFQ